MPTFLPDPSERELPLELRGDSRKKQRANFQEGYLEGFQAGFQQAQQITKQLYRDMALNSLWKSFPDLVSQFQARLEGTTDFIPFARLCVDMLACTSLEEARMLCGMHAGQLDGLTIDDVFE